MYNRVINPDQILIKGYDKNKKPIYVMQCNIYKSRPGQYL